jgi:hypothetical protein
MRLALVAGLLAASLHADSVGDLVARVQAALAARTPDAQVAAMVRDAKLTERLDEPVIEALNAGPLATEELERRRDLTAKLPVAAPVKLFDAPAPPSAEEQAQIIAHARGIAMEYSAGLPNFLGTETIRRFTGNKAGEKWKAGDTLVVDIASNGKQETYRLLTIDGKATSKSLSAAGGIHSSGEFIRLQRFVFEEKSQTAFKWERWARLRGRQAHVFAFYVDQQHSEYVLNFVLDKRYRGVAAARGLVYLDADTHKVLRIRLEAEGIPPDWPILQTISLLDYDFADVAGQSYLLPWRSEARIVAKDWQRRNVIQFGNYRRFSAEATLNFEKQ